RGTPPGNGSRGGSRTRAVRGGSTRKAGKTGSARGVRGRTQRTRGAFERLRSEFGGPDPAARILRYKKTPGTKASRVFPRSAEASRAPAPILGGRRPPPHLLDDELARHAQVGVAGDGADD